MIKLNLQTSLSTPLRSFSLGSEHSTVVAFQAVTPPTRVQVWSSTTFFLNFFFPPHSSMNHRVSVTSKHANFFVHKKQETATHTDALNHFFFCFLHVCEPIDAGTGNFSQFSFFFWLWVLSKWSGSNKNKQ